MEYVCELCLLRLRTSGDGKHLLDAFDGVALLVCMVLWVVRPVNIGEVTHCSLLFWDPREFVLGVIKRDEGVVLPGVRLSAKDGVTDDGWE